VGEHGGTAKQGKPDGPLGYSGCSDDTRQSGRIPTLDGMRAVAILLVLASHAINRIFPKL
jgi:hypothetical protein